MSDDPSYDSETDLADYTNWLHKTASTIMPPMDPGHDDLVQEGRIAMWRALQTYDPSKGALPSWLTTAARRRMLDVRRGKAETGQEPADRSQASPDARGEATRTKMKAFLREQPNATGRQIAEAVGISPAGVTYHKSRLNIDVEPPTYVSMDALLDQGFDPQAACGLLDSVLEAYHDGEIFSALDALTPAERKYVILRFWEGMAGKELKDAFGYEPGALWSTAKKRLAPRLGHLVGT